MTALLPPYSPNAAKTRILTNIPIILGGSLMIFDILSFIGSEYLATFLIVAIKTHIFPDADFLSKIQNLHIYKNFYLILGAVTTAIIWGKGLYTNRTPWWSQVQFITKVIIFSILVHAFLSSALKVREPLTLILLSWAFAFLFIIVLRALAYKLASFVTSWKIPTVIISDNPTAEDLIYAFSSDLCTGYDVKTIFLRSPDDNVGFDTSILPLPNAMLGFAMVKMITNLLFVKTRNISILFPLILSATPRERV